MGKANGDKVKSMSNDIAKSSKAKLRVSVAASKKIAVKKLLCRKKCIEKEIKVFYSIFLSLLLSYTHYHSSEGIFFDCCSNIND